MARQGEKLYMPMEHAAYLARPDFRAAKKNLTPSTAPRHATPRQDDPLSRHRSSLRTNNYYEEVDLDHRAKDPLLKALKGVSASRPTRSSAERYERHFLVASRGNASWRPESHVISS
ncbi:MAG: hypothetical protein AB2556_24625 [Candidatus Thiodiazotropha sp.]